MVRKGNLAVFEGSNISETEKVPPTKIGQLPNFPFRPWTIVHSIKKFNQSESLKKFIQVEIDELCMCPNFGCHGFSFSEILSFLSAFKNSQSSLQVK